MAQNLVILLAMLACCSCTTPEEMVEAFTSHEKNIWIGNHPLDRLIFAGAMKHRPCMILCEEGTEAATGEHRRGLVMFTEVFSFVADQPFIFFIVSGKG